MTTSHSNFPTTSALNKFSSDKPKITIDIIFSKSYTSAPMSSTYHRHFTRFPEEQKHYFKKDFFTKTTEDGLGKANITSKCLSSLISLICEDHHLKTLELTTRSEYC